MTTFQIDGYDRVVILLLLGNDVGNKFIEDTLINHHRYASEQAAKRRAANPNETYWRTSISKKIVHPAIPFDMRVNASAWTDRANKISMNVTLNLVGISKYKWSFSLDKYLNNQVEKYILGE